jgi:hypothetical protein
MHILIIEAALTGHHSGYLEHIAEEYLDGGNFVTATVLQRDATHPTIERLKEKYSSLFTVLSISDKKYEAAINSCLGEVGRELTLRYLFSLAYREVHQTTQVDYVFLPYLDYSLYAMGLLGSPFGHTQWGGICMRPSFHYDHYGVIAPKPKLAGVKRSLFLKLLRSKTLKSIHTIDELLQRFVSERHSKWSHRLKYFADPAELKGTQTYESARMMLSIPVGVSVMLVYGSIDARKGLEIIIEAMSSSDVPKDLHLLVVGRQSEGILWLMQSSKVSTLLQDGRLHVINSFVSDAMQQMVFVATDMVWLGYRDHYTMSGVLGLAELLKIPILGTNKGLIGWYIKEKQLGIAININNISEIKNSLIILAKNLQR